MRITWNGTGAAWSYHWGNSSAVIESDGKRLLIDCGHTAPARLAQMGLTLQDLDAVFVSHLHGDHCYGLEEWGFRSLLVWKQRPHLFIADTLATTLWENVLAGTMQQTCDQDCLLNDYFDVTPLKAGKPLTFDTWTLDIHPVIHIPNTPAYGVKVSDGKTTVAFTCDSRAPVASWFYEDTALVFHDCSFPPPFPDTVHAHFEELCRYPLDWRERTYLVHYDDTIKDKQTDPVWQKMVSDSRMRLTVPFEPIDLR
jgi:ribonuclease BN (tRNA processing enzyme)